MGRAELVQPELSPKPHQRRLRDVPAARHGGQEVRLVGDDDVLVLVEHRDVKRNWDLVAQFTVEVHDGAGGEHRRRVDHRAVLIDDFAGDRLGCHIRPEPAGQLVAE